MRSIFLLYLRQIFCASTFAENFLCLLRLVLLSFLKAFLPGSIFSDAALKRGLEPVVVFPKLQTTPVYQIMRQSAIEFWKNKGCRVIEPENDKEEETLLTTVKALNPIAIVSGSELCVPWTDFLTDKLNLCGNEPSTSVVRRNKYEMQQKLL